MSVAQHALLRDQEWLRVRIKKIFDSASPHFFRGPAIEVFGSAIPQLHPIIQISQHDCVMRQIDHARLQPPLRFRAFAFGNVEQNGHPRFGAVIGNRSAINLDGYATPILPAMSDRSRGTGGGALAFHPCRKVLAFHVGPKVDKI